MQKAKQQMRKRAPPTVSAIMLFAFVPSFFPRKGAKANQPLWTVATKPLKIPGKFSMLVLGCFNKNPLEFIARCEGDTWRRLSNVESCFLVAHFGGRGSNKHGYLRSFVAPTYLWILQGCCSTQSITQ